jgi:hypothetical protein
MPAAKVQHRPLLIPWALWQKLHDSGRDAQFSLTRGRVCYSSQNFSIGILIMSS